MFPQSIAARSALGAALTAASGLVALQPRFAVAAESAALVDGTAASTSSDTSELPSVASCVESHLSGQELRQNGQLLESRTQLLRCSHETCPDLVRSECIHFLDELRTQVPSIVLRVTVDGEPRSKVAAYVNDRQLFSELPTRAVEFDPGKYRFRFEYADLPAIEREVTIIEGEKRIPIAIAFESPITKTATNSQQVEIAPRVETEERRPVPWPVFALGGIGVVGLGGFVGFGLAARAKESDLRSSCSPGCSEEQIDSVRSRAKMADISLAVGGAAFVAAATYYYFRPTESVQVGAAISPQGGFRSQLRVSF